MRLILSLLFISLSGAALAQSAAPMVVVGGDAPVTPAQAEQQRLANQFPEWAVTNAGAATGGWSKDVPAPPGAPESPNVEPSKAAPSVTAPSAPASPANPISKLWPIDTIPIFMRSCVGFEPQLIAPCGCVIRELMVKMPHNEFLAKSADGSIEQDATLHSIRTNCAVAPQRKD
jgi:hypothetical protein